MPVLDIASHGGKPLIPCSHQPVAVTGRATLMFADLHGYEVLAKRLPAPQVAVLVAEFFAVVADAVALHGGEMLSATQATVMAGFGVFDARHTQIGEAVAAARSIQSRFAACRLAWQTLYDVDAAVGIGLHRGEVASSTCTIPKTQGHVLVGEAANLAASLGRRARAGEIILSDAVGLPYLSWAAALHTAAPANEATTLPLIQLPAVDLSAGREPLTLWCIPTPRRLGMRGGRQERRN
jgi:class 3 adenylate cyclase